MLEYVDGMPIDRWCDEHRLGIEAHARVPVAFEQPLDPHEQVRPDRLRTGVSTPDPAEQAGYQKQQDRGHDQQHGQERDVLRPQLQPEQVELAAAEIEQHILMELVAIGIRQANRRQTGIGIIGVDVNAGNLEAFCQIAGEVR